ncbi:hypothetical protein FDENT_9724 [Fusarium denticulatum]|uniref:Apple domain-containing protein n=1 Tax=Fusarium denticulatum TaxID=48507 RepID=A0A8H5WZD6_9HYPO|nr:hypothetical protein FDENT_9724 [Fusarium denticulatum]
MQSPKSRLSLWTLLLFLSPGALSAPESCDEMGDIYSTPAYSYTTECDTSLNNPLIYSSFYQGDTFAQCINRCDTDDVCSAVLYEDPTGNCYLAADFTSTSPSNGYSVAIKEPSESGPEPATTTTEVSIASTTEMPTIASTTEIIPETSTTEMTSEASTTGVSSIATTSEASSVASSTEVTSSVSTTEVSTIGSTSDISLVASTSGVSSIATTSEVTSLASTSEVSSAASTSDDCDETETSTEIRSTVRTSSSPLSESTSGSGTATTHSLDISTTSLAATASETSTTSDKSTAETSSVGTLATVMTSQGTESILSTSSEITTSTNIHSSPATTFETSQLSTLTTLTRPTSASTYLYVNPASETLSASGSTIKAPYPTGYTIRTVYQTLTKGATCTKTTFAETVTTATYVTVGPSHSALVTTCVPVTLLYSPCYCDHQVYPTLSMTTLVSPCSACGSNGENTVTLTVPKAACETTSGSYSHPIVQYPSGWTGGYQTAQNGTGNHETQYTVKSHQQPQGSPQHTYTNVQPSIPAPTAGVYSHSQNGKNGQSSAPIPTAGSSSNPQENKDSYQKESAQPEIENEHHSTQGETAHPTGPREVEAPGTTSVAISGADRVQAIMWIVMVVIAGMV